MNVKQCALVVVAVVCIEDKVDPVNFKGKWGEDELPIEDHVYVSWRRDLKGMFWDAYIL